MKDSEKSISELMDDMKKSFDEFFPSEEKETRRPIEEFDEWDCTEDSVMNERELK